MNATAYFRQNIPNFALYTAPLFELVSQTDPSNTGRKGFQMRELHIKYFNLLKRQIRNSLGIENPNYDRNFFAFCDANQLAISFVLFQLDIPLEEEESLNFSDKSTLERIEKLPKKFILCGSRKLEKRIRSQRVFKLELKSLLYFLKQFAQFVNFLP